MPKQALSSADKDENARPQRQTNAARRQEIIDTENEPLSDVDKPKKRRSAASTRKRRRKGSTSANQGPDEDIEDGDYIGSSSSDDSNLSDDAAEGTIPNAEVAEVLQNKTAPKKSATSKKRKRGDASAGPSTGPSTPKPDALDPSQRPIKQSRRTNPIYHFYEVVASNPKRNKPDDDGDIHYRCCHGNKEYFTITRKMNSNLNGLIRHLEKFPAVHKLFTALNESKRQPTESELLFCNGAKDISKENLTAIEAEIERTQGTIQKAFQKQVEKHAAPFEQKKFEELLLKWIVTCDQPFDEVDKPEFRELLEYIHGRPGLKIPGRTTIQKRAMELGRDTVEGTKKMIEELPGKVSLSLDAWTSSNQIAFLAIVMHYISKQGTLCELLIDFKEIIGEHSGDNMADIVWNTLNMYGLTDKVLAVVADNATSNDTLMVGLEERCRKAGIPFDARMARMRCMPHTIHLAASQLLEGIGAAKKKKKGARYNYQEDLAVPLTDDANEDAEALNDESDEDEESAAGPDEEEAAEGLEEESAERRKDSDAILRVVPKLRRIIRAVRGSPQRRKDWMRAAQAFVNKKLRDAEEAAASSTIQHNEHDFPQRALMLILDVITRWSSTHQMLERAIDFKTVIDDYTAKDSNKLRRSRLFESDWAAVRIVERWLISFRCATQDMSATKRPMLSSVHAVFRSLQESLREDLKALPDSCDPRLKSALIAAHKKLSDYYWKIDNESPFYLWASILDPRIMYEGLLKDCTDEAGSTTDDLNNSREALMEYFNANYAGDSSAPAAEVATPATAAKSRAKPFNFRARYNSQPHKSVNELEEYFRQPVEDFERCDPIAWWIGRRAMWPKLTQMALDILAIPGSAVAVERVFSGGRDTVSIRRASLKADTIRALMLIKQSYRQLRDVIELD